MGGSNCFGTMTQKTKHLQKSLGTTLELSMTFLSSSFLSRFRWEAAMATCWTPDWPQVCCKNMKWKLTEGSSNSLYCWFLCLLLRTRHTGDFNSHSKHTQQPLASEYFQYTYGHSQHSNRTRYRILKGNCGISVSTPGSHVSLLAHSLALHCLKIRSGSHCSTIPTGCNAAALKVSPEAIGQDCYTSSSSQHKQK